MNLVIKVEPSFFFFYFFPDLMWLPFFDTIPGHQPVVVNLSPRCPGHLARAVLESSRLSFVDAIGP